MMNQKYKFKYDPIYLNTIYKNDTYYKFFISSQAGILLKNNGTCKFDTFYNLIKYLKNDKN
jgi:hypothetical protein